MKNINQLRNARKEKIKKLSADELELYIDSLVSKSFGNLVSDPDTEIINSYLEKLDEVEELLKDKYTNISLHLLETKFLYSSVETLKMEKESKVNILKQYNLNLLNLFSALIFSYANLNSILRTYYTNYSTANNTWKILNEMQDEMGIDFDTDLKLKVVRNHGWNIDLMKSLDSTIATSRDILLKYINLLDKFTNVKVNEKYLNSTIENVKEDNSFLLKHEKLGKAIKESGYLELNLEWIDEIKKQVEFQETYFNLRKEIFELIDGDGFASLKESDFEVELKIDPDADKSEFMEDKPSYNVRKASFV